MYWALLALGVGIETPASAAFSLSDGFTKIGYAGLTLLCFGVAFYIMSRVVRTMLLSVASSVCAGVGVTIVTVMGAVVFDQSLDGYAFLGIAIILAGVVVLSALSTSASG